MTQPTVLRGEDYFSINTYEGNGLGQRVGNFVPYTDVGTIAKSCIFNDDDDPSLLRNLGSNGNRSKFTISTWLKRNQLQGSGFMSVITGGLTSSNDGFFFNSSHQAYLYFFASEALVTNRTFEDTSKFYHFVVRIDTSLSTADDRVRFYVDGDQVTSFATRNNPSQDATTGYFLNNSQNIRLGRHSSSTMYEGDYNLAETILADGQSYGPDTFGITDTSTGRWIPKDVSSGITYGTHGFRMHYANSAGQTIGDDLSGNGNDMTVENLVATDIVTDSPTQNHTTLNNIKNSNITLSEGNLRCATVSGAQGYVSGSNLPLTSGKYYGEITITTAGSTLFFVGVGNRNDYLAHYTEENPLSKIEGGYIRSDTGQGYTAFGDTGTYRTYGSSYTTNDIIGIAVDVDKGAVWISKNNTWYNSASASEIENGDVSKSLVTGVKGPLILLNYTHSGTTLDYNFGQKGFAYTPPTGYKAIQQDNFPETHKGISDFVWIKNRDAADAHAFYDSSRGPQKEWENSESNEATVTDGLQKFLKGGFQTEDNDALNTSGESYVAWNWVSNNGTEVANTAGSGATVATTVQANDTAGFSICRFQGTGSTLRFAHGLSATPEWFIVKRLDAGAGAATSVYHVTNGINKYLHLNETDGVVDSGAATTQFTGVSSTYIQLGSNANSNNNGSDIVAYVWRSVKGFSKFGSYTGNGNADGPFVYLGFKPSWIMLKPNAGGSWIMLDNKRNPINPINRTVWANLTTAESTSYTWMDFLSNGFKLRDASNGLNNSSATYLYMAFAKHPFAGTSSINPVTAH